MMPFPSGVRVWLATGHTDMRRGFDGLALLVQEQLKRDPHSGQLFVFRGRRGGLIKILWHDGQGMCLFAKRLERGRFIWPSIFWKASTGACRSIRGVHRLRDNGAANRLMSWIEWGIAGGVVAASPACHADPIRSRPRLQLRTPPSRRNARRWLLRSSA
jgi:transposase